MKDVRTKISVGVITYNQETTIRQTLDSILAQKGDFDLEVVVGEDCSPDGTYAICADYAERYPDVVKLLPNTKNLGIMANFARVMCACKGEYVGICAGDDYWCDELKLQKQLDYFRVHPEVGVCTTNGYKLYVQSGKMIPGIAPYQPYEDGNVKPFFFSAKYNGGLYATPLSMVIRRNLLKYVDFEEYIRRGFPVEDYPLQAVLAQYTKWGHINELCVVYRIYEASTTFTSFDRPNYLQYNRGLANVSRYLNELFPQDAYLTEELIQEQLFYKEFLLYLHQLNYSKAKKLINDVSKTIVNSVKVRQAKRFSKTRLHFLFAHYYKEYTHKKDLRKRINI